MIILFASLRLGSITSSAFLIILTVDKSKATAFRAPYSSALLCLMDISEGFRFFYTYSEKVYSVLMCVAVHMCTQEPCFVSICNIQKMCHLLTLLLFHIHFYSMKH